MKRHKFTCYAPTNGHSRGRYTGSTSTNAAKKCARFLFCYVNHINGTLSNFFTKNNNNEIEFYMRKMNRKIKNIKPLHFVAKRFKFDEPIQLQINNHTILFRYKITVKLIRDNKNKNKSQTIVPKNNQQLEFKSEISNFDPNNLDGNNLLIEI